MKGPGIRIDLDVRRIWTCPKCGAVRKTGGELPAVRCVCADEAWMLLQEPKRRRDLVPPPKSVLTEMTPDEVADEPESDVAGDPSVATAPPPAQVDLLSKNESQPTSPEVQGATVNEVLDDRPTSDVP